MSQHQIKKTFGAVTLLVVLFLTAGCTTMSDPEASQEYNRQVVGVLGPQQTIGQSFVSRRPNLNGITIWVSNPDDSQSAALQATLFASAASPPESLYTTTIQVAPQSAHTFIYIHIPRQSPDPQQSYYLELASNTSLQIDGRGEDAYVQGSAHFNGQPLEADLAFRLTYDYNPSALLEDLRGWAAQSPEILIFLLLLLLPGWLLLDLLNLRSLFSASEQATLAIGCSLALIPLVMLWTSTLGLHWNITSVRIAAWVLLALTLVRGFLSRFSPRLPVAKSDSNQRMERLPKSMTGIILASIFFLALGVRLAMVRDLATPAWVDSIHHGLITRLILDQGAFPTTYQPYLTIDPHVYHPGFHSIVAVFCWLTGLDIASALGLSGQILNALTVPAVFLLTRTLTKDSRAGLIAALVTGFLTPMPAYLASWGRFTHLTGLVILPALFTLVYRASKATRPRWLRLAIVGGLVAAGLFLVHYRALAFALLLIFAYALTRIPAWFLHRDPSAKPFLISISLTGISAVLVTLPWLLPFLQNILLPRLAPVVTTTMEPFADFSWRFLSTAYGKQALALAALGLIWAIIRMKSFAATILLWVASLLILANLGALGLPGSDLVNNTSVVISLFMPVSVAAGFLVSQWLETWRRFLPQRFRPWFAASVLLASGIIAWAGASQLPAPS